LDLSTAIVYYLEDLMKLDIKPGTPLSVLLHLHPEAEIILKDYFKDMDFASITERVKTLEDISREGNVEVNTLMEDLKKKLEQ